MSRVVRAGVQHWVGEDFPEPEDRELAPYGYRHPDDVDELAVERACKNDPPPTLTPAERRIIVPRLHAQGLNDNEIAKSSGINREVVGRIRRALGLPAIVPPRADDYYLPTKSRKASA